MVCKEEIFSWFQNLKSSKRVEAMCVFLNMCYPLELRFYGTCLEDLGRKDFCVFKDEAIKANEISEVLKIRNIHEPCARSKLIVALSLLNTSNAICAKELFKVLSEEVKIETLASMGILSEAKNVEQYLLALTLAQHHPAFTFDQQTYLTNLSISLETYVADLYSRIITKEACMPVQVHLPQVVPHQDGFPSSSHSYRYHLPRSSDTFHNQVQITSLKVKPPHKKMCIRIRVAWGSNRITDAFKTPHDLLVFHQKLSQMYPTEAKNNCHEKCIPPIPHVIAMWNKQSNLSESVISATAEYIQQLNLRLPGYVLENEFVVNFFMPSFPNRAIIGKCNRSAEASQTDVPPKNSRLRSLTIYNSQMAENSPQHRLENRQKPSTSVQRKLNERTSGCAQSSPVNSVESPLSSPYTSPMNSETNSRATSPWSVVPSNTDLGASHICSGPSTMEKMQRKEMSDQWDSLRPYKIEELQAMPIEELESLGILKDDSATKSTKEAEIKSPSNGLIGCYLPRNALLMKSAPLLQPRSNESSPVCSEYSSPPQSPSPGEPCNQSSSLSSSNEDTTEKRPLSKALEMCRLSECEPTVPEPTLKCMDSEPHCMKGHMNRSSVSVIPFAVPYSSLVTQLPPPQNMKPAYLPIPCRTNSAPQHLSPAGAVVFDNQFSRLPLPSALTFIPGPPARTLAGNPDRVLSSPNLPIATVSPFPVATSGCTTVPSASCSITTQKNSNSTAVTNSGLSSHRYASKNSPLAREGDIVKTMQHVPEAAPYATGYILNTSSPLTAVSCSCFTTNSTRSSPAPSSAIPQQPAVSMSYLGMPYLFHSIPFLQAQSAPNGFVPQPAGQGYSYALSNGITAISPELIYPGQTFTLQSPPTQSNACPVATPASQCYGAFPQTTAVPIKLISCYNCGKVGHRGSDCKEQTMDDMHKSGKFQLNFSPLPKMPDSHD